MHTRSSLAFIAFLALSALTGVFLSACGRGTSDDPAPAPAASADHDQETNSAAAAQPTTKEGRTEAALRTLFGHIQAGERSAAAGLLVYRGEDKERSWKSLCDDTRAEDKDRIDAILRSLDRKLGVRAEGAEPTFLTFRSERESEGEWLVWKVQMGEKSAWCACLEIDGTIALGDVDSD